MFVNKSNRTPLSNEDLKARWKALSNDGRTPLNESTSNSSRATLMEKVSGRNGITYGILQENSHFYLKQTTKAKNEAMAADFEYIGGTQNILAERFNSFADASRRLNAKLYSLHEGLAPQPEVAPEGGEEDGLLAQLGQKDQEEAAAPAADGGAGMEDPLADPMGGADGMPADPAAGAPAEGGAPEEGGAADGLADLETAIGGDAPAGDAPAEGGADGLPAEGGADGLPADPAAEGGAPEGDPTGLPAEGGEEGAPADGEGDPEGGEGGDSTQDAMKTLGKLGQQLSAIGDLSPEFAKTVLNTVITKTKTAIASMADEDVEKLQQRLGKGGKELDEEEGLGDWGMPGTATDKDPAGLEEAKVPNLYEGWSSVAELTKMLVGYEISKAKK